MENTDEILDKTIKIIKKYYDHPKKNPVLKHTSPETLKKNIKLTINEKGMKIDELFNEIEKIALNSPKTNSK